MGDGARTSAAAAKVFAQQIDAVGLSDPRIARTHGGGELAEFGEVGPRGRGEYVAKLLLERMPPGARTSLRRWTI